MSDFTTIYDYDTLELLTNTDKTIDTDDEDYKYILKCLDQTNYLKISGVNKESKAIAPKNVSEKSHAAENHYADRNKLNSELGYHDLLQTFDEATHQSTCANNKGKRKGIFPITLFKLLENSEASGCSSVISWLPHGRAFQIHNEMLFEKHVLKAKKYFRQSKCNSFKRQLHYYGFKKIKSGFSDYGAYFHESFIRGQIGMCSKITRWKWDRASSGITCQAPNFDEIPRILHNLSKCVNLDESADDQMECASVPANARREISNNHKTVEENNKLSLLSKEMIKTNCLLPR